MHTCIYICTCIHMHTWSYRTRWMSKAWPLDLDTNNFPSAQTTRYNFIMQCGLEELARRGCCCYCVLLMSFFGGLCGSFLLVPGSETKQGWGPHFCKVLKLGSKGLRKTFQMVCWLNCGPWAMQFNRTAICVSRCSHFRGGLQGMNQGGI